MARRPRSLYAKWNEKLLVVSSFNKNIVKSPASAGLLVQLELINDNNIKNPVNFYLYYAGVYESLGDFEEALDYQEEAIETLEDLGEEEIPQYMLDKLTLLESKVG